MAQIERRQARIRQIRSKNVLGKDAARESVPVKPEKHHVIGTSENVSEHLAMFVRKNQLDPAIEVWVCMIAMV